MATPTTARRRPEGIMAEITPIRTGAEASLFELFPAVKARLPGVAAQREEAFESFAKAGLPHRRVEAYKYTDLRTLMRDIAPLATEPNQAAIASASTAADPLAGVEAARIVIVDGHVAPALSDFGA